MKKFFSDALIILVLGLCFGLIAGLIVWILRWQPFVTGFIAGAYLGIVGMIVGKIEREYVVKKINNKILIFVICLIMTIVLLFPLDLFYPIPTKDFVVIFIIIIAVGKYYSTLKLKEE